MEIGSFLSLSFFLITLRLPSTISDNSTLIHIHTNTTISEGDQITKPGCPSKCGNLTVPYPFGITGCSINNFFEINCDNSFNPPKAFLSPDNLEVLSIQDTKILVKNHVAFTCYNKLGNVTDNISVSMNLTGTPFSFSSENKLNAVGCDDISLLTQDLSDYENSDYISSCVAICNKTQDLSNDSCSGIGCCQSSIPNGLQSIYVNSITMGDHASVQPFNPCGFAFIAEQDSYTFQVSDISRDASVGNRTMDPGPLVIDWVIDDSNCSQIQYRVCQEYSVCVDSDTGFGGYRCNCSDGYKGNPYLSPGCQAINECEYNPCVKSATCINIPGSYNCSCKNHYVGDGKNDGTGCLYLPPPSKTTMYAGLGIGFGSFFVLLCGYGLYNVLKKRKLKQLRKKLFKKNGGLLLQQTSDAGPVLEKMRLFTSKELEKATDRFNESRILGRGGQGTVYKGMLSDGRIVAVKKSKQLGENQLQEFINEVVILSQINHRNVVNLLGCCLETEVPLLVYEFISNGILFDIIQDGGTSFPFSWDMRLRIAAEVASALAYLHYATSIPIYHRDMKTTNILLDEKYRAKLADFGISRSVSVDQTHLTTKVKGTFGYLDPEYFQTSKFTKKSDVYSFGVVLAELLTGEKPISTSTTEEERSLVTRFLLTMEADCLKTIIAPQIMEEGFSDEHFLVAKLAQRCLNSNGRKRPNMREVAMELECIRARENLSFVENPL